MKRELLHDLTRQSSAKRVWFGPTQPPTDTEQTACTVLVRWFEVPETFEARATWQPPDAGSTTGYFKLFLWDDEHEQGCRADPGKVDIVGWRYEEMR